MSTVSFAGFSRLNGELKFRTANDVKRIDQLRKLGDTDVVILQLPTDMSKTEAADYVLTNLAVSYPDFDTVAARDLLDSIVGRTVRIKRPVKVTVPSTAQVKLTGTRIKVSRLAAEADDVVYKKIAGTDRVLGYSCIKRTEAQKAQGRDEWNRAHAHLSYDAE
jgi:hypothetical protein